MRKQNVALAVAQARQELPNLVARDHRIAGRIGMQIRKLGEHLVLRNRAPRANSAAAHQRDAARKAFHQRQGRIRAEAVALVDVEPFDGAHQRDVAVADQLHQVHSRPQVLAGDAHNQATVCADDVVLGFASRSFSSRARANCGSSFRRACTN